MQIDPNNYYDVLTNYEISTAEEEISENVAANYLLHEFVNRSPAKLLEQYIADKRNGYQKEGFDRLFNSENIKRWMSGRPISRDKAFELSIYFGLDMAESEIFVRKYCMCDWLYLRDYSDSVYSFFIKNAAALGLDGGQAVEKVREVIKAFDDVYEEHINNVAVSSMTYGDYGLALEHFDTAKKYMADELSEPKYFKDPDKAREIYVFMLCNIAELMTSIGDIDRAFEYLRKADSAANDFNDARTEARCMALFFQKTANLLYRQGRKKDAFEYLDQSQKNAMIDLLANAEIYLSDLCMMSKILCDINELEAAKGFAELAASAVDILTDSGRIKAGEALAYVYYKRGEYEKAYDEYDKTLKLIRSAKFYSSTFMIVFYNDFACVCEKLKNFERAAALMRRALWAVYNCEYYEMSTEELIANTKELLIKYKDIGINNVFTNAIKYHLAVGDRETSEIFYRLLNINRECLDHYTKTWIDYYRDHYLKRGEN